MNAALADRTAAEMMSRHVVTVHPKESIRETLGLLYENGLSSLPVVANNEICVGVISARDILEWAKDLDDGLDEATEVGAFYADMVLRQVKDEGDGASVEELMSDSVVYAEPAATMSDVIDMMLNKGIHHLPVLDGDKRLMGVLSTVDVLRSVREIIKPN